MADETTGLYKVKASWMQMWSFLPDQEVNSYVTSEKVAEGVK